MGEYWKITAENFKRMQMNAYTYIRMQIDADKFKSNHNNAENTNGKSFMQMSADDYKWMQISEEVFKCKNMNAQ